VRVQATAPATAGPEPAPPAPAPALDKSAIADRAGEALAAVKTAEGRFVQVDPYGEVSEGRFWISRPGRIRFEYTAPETIYVISDGVSVSIEEPRRRTYDAVPLSSTPFAMFLRDDVDLRRSGDLVDVRTEEGAHVVTLEDKGGEAEGQLALRFAEGSFDLLGWTAYAPTGETTRVTLSDVRVNAPVKPSLFIVKDPEARRGRD
jgi:outer membrane lipoprotein-sorting protein